MKLLSWMVCGPGSSVLWEVTEDPCPRMSGWTVKETETRVSDVRPRPKPALKGQEARSSPRACIWACGSESISKE